MLIAGKSVLDLHWTGVVCFLNRSYAFTLFRPHPDIHTLIGIARKEDKQDSDGAHEEDEVMSIDGLMLRCFPVKLAEGCVHPRGWVTNGKNTEWLHRQEH